MKRFIFKTSAFVIPFFILYLLNVLLYKKDQGDLIRIGYLYTNPLPMKNIVDKYSSKRDFELVSEINLNKTSEYDVFTIGDSFSEQNSLGYQNYLANLVISVLHFDRFLSTTNPVEQLIQLINSDFFDSIHVNYVILQSIERTFVQRCQNLNNNESIRIESLKKQIDEYEKKYQI